MAEPVGSCTDLVATVTYPLRRLYGKDFTISPLSVLVDPVRARRVFGLEKGGSFPEKVLYIYRKQLEEADIIVISKADILDAERTEELRKAISGRYPNARVLDVSARTGLNFNQWYELVTGGEQMPRTTMPVDYDTYAEGEALLGWLNCTAEVAADQEFSADNYLRYLTARIQAGLRAKGAEIAHLKMTFSPEGGLGSIAVANLVRNDFVPELSVELEDPVKRGQLIVNLRAEAPPHVLGSAVQDAVAATPEGFATLKATLDHLDHFRPGRPTPTHRDQQNA